MTDRKNRLAWVEPFLLSVVVLALMLNPVWLEMLWLDTSGSPTGNGSQLLEVWRWISAHFVHLNIYHALLNIAGVWVCFGFAPGLFNRNLPFKLLYLSLGISLCILWWSPDLLPYAGLSGVLYGLFVFGLFPRVFQRDKPAAMALTVVTGWMLWQLLVGASAQEEALIGGKIASMAHLYGYCLAMLWVVLVAAIRRDSI